MAGIGYAFISAYLKGEEARMVTSDHLSAVMKAGNYQEAVDAIHDTDIGNFLEGLDIQTFDELDEKLWTYFSSCISRIGWFTSVPKSAKKLASVYTTRYDIQNIKTALQNIITGIKTRGIPAGKIHDAGLLTELMDAVSLDEVKSLLHSCNLAEYSNILETYRNEDGIRKEVLTDTGLESLYFSNMLVAVKKSKDSSALTKVFNTMIDLTNLQIILRAVMSDSVSEASGRTVSGGYLLGDSAIRELLTLKYTDISSRIEHAELRPVVEEIVAAYEKDGNISTIDETIVKYKYQMVSDILSPRIMSPVVVVWYLFLKEIEVRNVRLVLKAALDNIPFEEIKNYLVF